MDILYFCPHRIIPPKGKPGILIGGTGHQKITYSIRSISKHETTDSL